MSTYSPFVAALHVFIGGGAGAESVEKLTKLIDLLLPHPRSMR